MKTFDERRKSVNEYVSKIKAKRRKTAIMSTGICLAVAILSAVLFIPYNTTPPDVSMYADSEYYTVIQQLNLATYQKPIYKNTFQALGGLMGWLRIFDVKFGAMAPTMDAVNNGEANYVETTDNQVQNIIEADIIKRSDRYIYYLHNYELRVYRIAGADSRLVGTYMLELKNDKGDSYHINKPPEIFLASDCSTVTLVLSVYNERTGAGVKLMNLDVTDPSSIALVNEIYFTGSLSSTRMVDDHILLAYNYGVRKKDIDFNDPATYVPQYGTPENMQCIPAENIVCPEKATDARYTVLCKLDGNSLDVKDVTALMSYSQELYVSENAIYATYAYNDYTDQTPDGGYTSTAMTEITGVSYAGEGLEILGTVTLEGTVKNQYSMDEFKGILRVVTSTSTRKYEKSGYHVAALPAQRNVNLYCINLANWQVKASVIGFAPAGEEATSVRFDGTNAYICTAEMIELTDPVYFFDLSDLSNITYTDTGIIDGYSTSLIQLGNGYLMGIGYGERRNLKIEIYEETEEGVVSVYTYEQDASFSEEYKSYFIDREKSMVGLAVRDWNSREDRFILLQFDGYQLSVVETVRCEGTQANVRAVLIDGYLYVLSSIFKVKSLA